MSTAQLLEQFKQLSDVERLEFIEAATRLVRENLTAGAAGAAADRNQRMKVAAAGVKDLYEAGGELTEWTVLDAEDFTDEYLQR